MLAARLGRVRSIYSFPSAMSASSATCTSISGSTFPAHTRCQLEAQVEILRADNPTTNADGRKCGKDKNCRFESTVYTRYLACFWRCVKRRSHPFPVPFFLGYIYAMTAWPDHKAPHKRLAASTLIEESELLRWILRDNGESLRR